MKTKFRWNSKLSVWEFFEAAWGGWHVMEVSLSNPVPMTFSEGFNHIILSHLCRGHEHETGWLADRCFTLHKNITELGPEPQPHQHGWLCPKCGRGNAPTTPTCPCMGLVEDGSTCSNAVGLQPLKIWLRKD